MPTITLTTGFPSGTSPWHAIGSLIATNVISENDNTLSNILSTASSLTDTAFSNILDWNFQICCRPFDNLLMAETGYFVVGTKQTENTDLKFHGWISTVWSSSLSTIPEGEQKILGNITDYTNIVLNYLRACQALGKFSQDIEQTNFTASTWTSRYTLFENNAIEIRAIGATQNFSLKLPARFARHSLGGLMLCIGETLTSENQPITIQPSLGKKGVSRYTPVGTNNQNEDALRELIQEMDKDYSNTNKNLLLGPDTWQLSTTINFPIKNKLERVKQYAQLPKTPGSLGTQLVYTADRITTTLSWSPLWFGFWSALAHEDKDCPMIYLQQKSAAYLMLISRIYGSNHHIGLSCWAYKPVLPNQKCGVIVDNGKQAVVLSGTHQTIGWLSRAAIRAGYRIRCGPLWSDQYKARILGQYSIELEAHYTSSTYKQLLTGNNLKTSQLYFGKSR
jgi:hypothetical protein